MVFYRANMTSKMCRNVLVRPAMHDEQNMTAHMAMTLAA